MPLRCAHPVRAGIVKEPGGWRRSSYNATIGAQSSPLGLKVDGLLAQFGQGWGIAIRYYKRSVEEGIGRESLWQELKIYLGDERFIKRLQSRLKSKESEDVSIPRAQRRGPAPSVELIGTRHEDRNEAVVAVYETGEYTYERIGKHFGVHFTTVGRLVRAARKIGKKM